MKFTFLLKRHQPAVSTTVDMFRCRGRHGCSEGRRRDAAHDDDVLRPQNDRGPQPTGRRVPPPRRSVPGPGGSSGRHGRRDVRVRGRRQRRRRCRWRRMSTSRRTDRDDVPRPGSRSREAGRGRGGRGRRGERLRGGDIPRRRQRRILPLRKRRGRGRGGATLDQRIPPRPTPRDPPGGRLGGECSSVTVGRRGGGLVPSSPLGLLSRRATGGRGLGLDPLRSYPGRLPPPRSL